ncbi:MAG: disulfide bond formation protein B [Janthinobacterium lividum]
MSTAVAVSPKPGPAFLASVIALVSAATVAAVWLLQEQGYSPCELCLKERIPFYVALPVAALLGLLRGRLDRRVAPAGFALLTLVFAVGAVLGAYHTGVEWHLWAGPTGCSGAASTPADVGDFLKALNTVTVVRCDEAALHVLGLSLAAWNALLSAVLAAIAVSAMRRSR